MKKRPSGTARRPSPTQSSGPSIIPALSVSPGQQGGARLDEQLARLLPKRRRTKKGERKIVEKAG